jgi:hypothetical protein
MKRTWKKVSLPMALVFFACAAGCEPGNHIVRARAANDLSCHEGDVEVHQTDVFPIAAAEPKGTATGFVWIAFGCGKRIEYVCHSENDDPIRGQYRCEVRTAPPRPAPPQAGPISVEP